MINLNEVKSRAARKNSHNNNRLHFFASNFSIYFSWFFINMGMSANQVTVVFFITGLLGSFFLLSSDMLFILIGYMLWRLHIIFDLCDGDVARFRQEFSINGAYWDYMIHSILYPLFFVSISFSLYVNYGNVYFLYIAMFGSIVVSQMLSVKNNYYRAMLFNNIKHDPDLGKNNQNNASFALKNAVFTALSFEGFLFLYLIFNLFFDRPIYFIFLLCFYILIFALIVLQKFYLFSRYGFYSKRS
ncbi:hypothetical protein MNBD_GAMMA12-3539 [hydrothermal vent metagenome]|uniref:CDP-diacylglycerol--glycerol-3-phosphate 3-phosphatidyltransferase n=1 Tax=hydrothermal vent metagenome TaxID=652676 RepID=A0A3B0YKS4_9ZZZZ